MLNVVDYLLQHLIFYNMYIMYVLYLSINEIKFS